MASTLFCRESGCWNCTEHPWSTQRGLCLKWSSFICCHVKSILCDWCERSDTSRMTTHTGRWWLGTGFPQRVNLFRVAILEMIHDPGVCQIFCFFSIDSSWLVESCEKRVRFPGCIHLEEMGHPSKYIMIHPGNSLDKAVWHLPFVSRTVLIRGICVYELGVHVRYLKFGKFHTFCE